MTKQEKWDQLVNQISELGEELQEIFESLPGKNEDIESSLLSLRLTVDELTEQVIED